MGLEYRVTFHDDVDSIVDFEQFKQFRSFWKYDEVHGNYYLGRTSNSDWPELILWRKDQSLGITVNGGVGSAFKEIQEYLKNLKETHSDLEVTDWDSGEDVSTEFFAEL